MIDIEEEVMMRVFQIYHDMSVSNQNQSILSNLEEGIIVFKDNEISYQNQVFKSILKRIKLVIDRPQKNLMDEKLFKLIKQTDSSSSNDLSKNSKEESLSYRMQIGRIFSLKDLLSKKVNYLKDKIFEIDLTDSSDQPNE